MENESQIKEYIQTKQKDSIVWTIDSVKSEFSSLVWKEEEETKTWLHFLEWLKNDKNLLKYAELKNKEWELERWDKMKLELLEVKLSITCPYFADFKEFLEELKKWEHVDQWQGTDSQSTQTSQSETGSQSTDTTDSWWSQPQTAETIPETAETIHSFCWTNLSEIQSYPYYKNSKTWVTRCSATAQMNGKNFGLNLPNGDAYNAGTKPWNDSICTLPKDKKDKKPSKRRPTINPSEFQSVWDDANFADIYVESKSNYGHRAVAFRDSTWQRYVLDPYIRVKWDLNNSPKKLEDYLSTKKIVKSHFYKSSWYSDKHLAYK